MASVELHRRHEFGSFRLQGTLDQLERLDDCLLHVERSFVVVFDVLPRPEFLFVDELLDVALRGLQVVHLLSLGDAVQPAGWNSISVLQ